MSRSVYTAIRTNQWVTSLHGDYDRIVRPIERQMMQSAWRYTQNAEDADDAFQEAIAQILRRMHPIRSHPNPQALILRVCTNVACDIVRRRLRRVSRERPLGGEDPATSAGDAAAALLDSKCRNQVSVAVARLPERQGTAVTMRFLLDCSYEKVATALGCAEATARVHAARGLEKLRDLLADLNPSLLGEHSS